MGDEPTLYEHDVDVNGWVIEVQTALAAAGHDPGPPDGKFGRRTARAVIEFQRSFGLKSDGIVGNQTWAALRGRAPEPPGVNNKPYGSTVAEPEPEPVLVAAASGAASGAAATQPAAAEPAADGGLVVPDGEPTEPASSSAVPGSSLKDS